MGVKNADGFVAAARDDAATIELHTSNTLLVTSDGLYTHARFNIPHLYMSIARRRDNLIFINLNGVDRSGVTRKGHEKGIFREGDDLGCASDEFPNVNNI